MHSDQQLGLYIRHRLQQIPMSRSEFGKHLGRNRSYAERIVRGQTLSPSLLPTVAKVLGVTVRDLMEPPVNH
jgi:transcriptional regulator with XRE-family HTH domain